MKSSHYKLITRWTFAVAVGSVWNELMHPEHWPQWWKGVRAVELIEQGDSAGVGAYRRMTWRSALPYELTFNMRTTRIEPQRLIEGHADGQLSGRGLWTLTSSEGRTDVQYEWEVEATRYWMRALAPLARPLFAWNHGVIMEWGRQGLARRIGAP